MNIPSLETILTDLDEARRQRNASNHKIEELTDALDNAGLIIERLTHERDNLLDAQAKSLQTIVKLTAERDELKAQLAKYQNLEPFGFWHQGNDIDESDFFLYSESGDVSCSKCIKLYALEK